MNKKGMDLMFIVKILLWLVAIGLITLLIRKYVVGAGTSIDPTVVLPP